MLVWVGFFCCEFW